MPKFIMSYYMGTNPPFSPEEGAEHMARYQEWIMEHQDALIEPENPLMNKRLITENGVADGGKQGSMMGYGLSDRSTGLNHLSGILFGKILSFSYFILNPKCSLNKIIIKSLFVSSLS